MNNNINKPCEGEATTTEDRKVCPLCGKPIPDGEGTRLEDGRVVCDECRDSECVQCRDCGDWLVKGAAYQYGDEWVCKYCKETYYRTCADCGKLTQAWHRTNEGFVCSDCIDNYKKCVECGEYFKEYEMLVTHSGEYVCQHCRDEYYFRCADCDELYHVDCRHTIDDEDYCDNCYGEHEHNSTEGVYDYHDYGNYKCLREEHDKDNLYLGVELECDDGSFDYSEFSQWDHLIHFEHDGSLSDNGVECISQPCTLNYHQNRMPWDGICKRLISQDFSSHNTGCCGLHVHLSRPALSTLDIVKMDVWFNRWGLWRDIARRETFYDCHYHDDKKIDMGHAVDRHYGRTKMESKLHNKYFGQGNCDRYQAVNTQNNNTVEVRIFRGTLKYETVIGTLEAVHGLVHFGRTIPVKRIYDTARLQTEFVQYLADHSADYPHVMSMLNRLLQRPNAKGRTSKEIYGIVGKFADSASAVGED